MSFLCLETILPITVDSTRTFCLLQQQRIEASDADTGINADIVYRLQGDAAARLFSIHPTTAQISVTAQAPLLLDRETRSTFEMEVRSQFPPHLGQHVQLTWGRWITLRTGLSHSQRPPSLQIVAQDAAGRPGGLSSTAQLTVTVDDVNDNAPSFTQPQYVFSVLETQRRGTRVGAVTATDSDAGLNARVYYSVVSGGQGMFHIDTTTGSTRVCQIKSTVTFRAKKQQRSRSFTFRGYFSLHVCVISGDLFVSGDLDRETKQHYVLNVSAIDGGLHQNSAFATVRITVLDENDNSPVFSKSHYKFQISENQPAGTVLSQGPRNVAEQVFASDADEGHNAKLHYEILGQGSNISRALKGSSKILTNFSIFPSGGQK